LLTQETLLNGYSLPKKLVDNQVEPEGRHWSLDPLSPLTHLYREIPFIHYFSTIRYGIIGYMKRDIARSLAWTGAALCGLSAMLYVVMELWTRWERAKTPGERNLGVAALFITFATPLCASASAGLICWGVAALIVASRRLRFRGSD
jgi:hypothetical protein